MTVVTAEWICTRCGVTNRKLVAVPLRETTDRCVHCKLRHHVIQDERPVRWRAEAA
ncbi:MAG TPA: hypothetical protein VGM77_01260 [Gemmatimonadales bacterium]|jgi:NMD protein affecting ribosome stability and mRNA decay